MTPEQLREAAAVMIAAADGKQIQMKPRYGIGSDQWSSVNAGWDWYGNEYRIKPEPRKVKVAIFINPADGYLLPIMQVDWPRFEAWKRVSDLVEIEVKDE